jgi:hypothetical protein
VIWLVPRVGGGDLGGASEEAETGIGSFGS